MCRTLKIFITTLTTLVLLSSCSSHHVRTGGDTPESIYDTALDAGVKLNGRISMLPGADRSDLPYVPIIKPSEIARIWIYDHITPSGDLVVGHWIFIKLRPERWYIEDDDEKPDKAYTKIPLLPNSGETGEAQQTLLPQRIPQQSGGIPNIPLPPVDATAGIAQ